MQKPVNHKSLSSNVSNLLTVTHRDLSQILQHIRIFACKPNSTRLSGKQVDCSTHISNKSQTNEIISPQSLPSLLRNCLNTTGMEGRVYLNKKQYQTLQAVQHLHQCQDEQTNEDINTSFLRVCLFTEYHQHVPAMYLSWIHLFQSQGR